MKPLLSLVLLVKNESSSIRQVLEAALPFADRASVLDTGSIDGTQDIVREVAAQVGQPIDLFEEPFVDFATSRNRALALDASVVRPAEFQLVLSADEFLRDGDSIRTFLETQRTSGIDLFKLRLLIDETSFFTPRVFRTSSAWQYVGKVHEYPTHHDATAAVGDIPTTWIEHIVSDHEKRFSNIWEVHIPMLKEQLEENPVDERALVFLASSYEALLPQMPLGERVTYAMTAMSLYLRRLALPIATDAERNYLRYRFLDNARLTGVYTHAELFDRCVELKKDDPHRPETALLWVQAGMMGLPVTEVYWMAVEAARVAQAAKGIANSAPVSMGCEWKAFYYATKAAYQISRKKPDAMTDKGVLFSTLVQQHIADGIAAGGPPEQFRLPDENAVVIQNGPTESAQA